MSDAVWLPEGLWQVSATIVLPQRGITTMVRRFATERRAVDQVDHIRDWPYPSLVTGVHFTPAVWSELSVLERDHPARAREEQHSEL